MIIDKVIIAVLFFFGFIVPGRCENVLSPKVVKIKSIDAFKFESKLEPPVLKVQVTIENTSSRPVRIQNGKFEIWINPNNTGFPHSAITAIEADLIGSDEDYLSKTMYLGKTTIAIGDSLLSNHVDELTYLEIGSYSSVAKIFRIFLPETIAERIRTIYTFINYMGFSKTCKDILMSGKATFGTLSKIGWTYQHELPMELIYSPNHP